MCVILLDFSAFYFGFLVLDDDASAYIARSLVLSKEGRGLQSLVRGRVLIWFDVFISQFLQLRG